MAPHWTGVNYGAKGFAKTICHARALAGSRHSFFFFFGNDPSRREKKIKNFQALFHGGCDHSV